uniref:Coatomer subunit zeta n=1 Tax=Pyxicephalus adspersus TaxID=30357 RepID=A0AAV3B0A4_PYXAD|nr:TPA: hypothetical protein GDO54_000524 [Pyxicephalus adspersus]
MTECMDPTLYTVKAVLILDNDGERLFAKYYDETYPTVKEQKSFEKNIFNKTHRTDSEIALLEGLTVVYKSSIDLYFYVIGSSHENELMLMAVLNCLFDSLSQMLRYGDDVPLTEQTVSQVLQSAKEQIKWSLLR